MEWNGILRLITDVSSNSKFTTFSLLANQFHLLFYTSTKCTFERLTFQQLLPRGGGLLPALLYRGAHPIFVRHNPKWYGGGIHSPASGNFSSAVLKCLPL